MGIPDINWPDPSDASQYLELINQYWWAVAIIVILALGWAWGKAKGK